jgi:hypothetical protein
VNRRQEGGRGARLSSRRDANGERVKRGHGGRQWAAGEGEGGGGPG